MPDKSRFSSLAIFQIISSSSGDITSQVIHGIWGSGWPEMLLMCFMPLNYLQNANRMLQIFFVSESRIPSCYLTSAHPFSRWPFMEGRVWILTVVAERAGLLWNPGKIKLKHEPLSRVFQSLNSSVVCCWYRNLSFEDGLWVEMCSGKIPYWRCKVSSSGGSV